MCRIITVTWGTLTMRILRPIVLFPPVRPGHCQQLHHVVVRKLHTDIFVSNCWCWHVLGLSHYHPCLLGDQPQLLLTSEVSAHVTVSTGMAATPSSGVVACVQKVRDAKYAIQMFQMWCGASFRPNLFWKLPHKKWLIRLLLDIFPFVPLGISSSLHQHVSKITWIFTTFSETYVLHYTIRTLQHLWCILSNVCFLPHKLLFVSQIYLARFSKSSSFSKSMLKI